MAGFVFQFFATGESAIRLLGEVQADDSGNVARVVAVYSEYADQDAVVEREGDRFELVQVKFSSDSSRRFDADELRKIITALNRARESLASAGSTVVAYRLVTNRSSEEAIKSSLKTLSLPGPGAAKRKEIRDALEVRIAYFDRLKSQMDRYLSQLGGFREERQRAVLQLAGTLLTEGGSPGSSRYTRGRVHEVLLGAGNARTVASEGSVRVLRSCQDSFARLNTVPTDEQLLHRTDAGAQLDSLCLQHARIVVTGQGGSGKSTFLADWAREHLQRRRAVLLDSVKGLADRSWFARHLSETLGFGTTHDRAREDIATTLGRLGVISNAEDLHPVLIVALDAADEATATRHVAEELWRAFYPLEQAALAGRGPPATLILSCRDLGASEMTSIFNPSPIPGQPLEDFGHMEVRLFTEQEVTELESRLGEAVPPDVLLLADDVPQDGRPEPSSEVKRALRHPIMWRFYARLDSEARESVRRGDDEPLARWAAEAVEWLYHRVGQLTHGQQTSRQTRTVLEALGRSGTWDAAGVFTLARFRERALATGLSEISVRELLAQLQSSGLIEPLDSTSMRWVYSFVAYHLARGGGA